MKRTISALALFIFIAVANTACSTTRKHFRDTSARPSMLDTLQYDSLMKKLANGDKSGRWPVKTKEYPLPGAILPFNRIVAFYGNLYSKNMGVLGQYPRKTMLNKLKEEVKNWEKADTATNVVPALHYICVTAQADAGRNGLHNLRMPFSQIDTVISWAKSINALVFLDIQVGFSTVQTELPLLEKYMKMPNVHLGIDPEFSMKEGSVPGKRIGTFDADDINYVTGYLAKLAKKNDLPPKIFVVHRFTKRMVTNYKDIKLRPEVQVVMDMDGWGGPELKKGTYKYFISEEPVQFTGFKLFYKNDLKNEPHRMLTPKEILSLKPAPIYIQYQ
ncbi:hypothetical protein DIU31_007030 [Mucilaginibacter rubeus]|uniref:Lipoprotein n=1 Tax=Mucilaginibacter rubeus TaxID=2027860 RepID=A0AAE6JD94_9SPHI|nr:MULTISPECIES: hypothetical protein [Mucilaginibacter]QEM03286.1 hypothetical protein DIU31_007030 [Mucilaginibacter rubeus]QEM15904.1 hypothetical protein DIU38_007110 [Mucilaginibacter gossypii]QTE41354.1 hypothetical protein J3L19_20655 [Mucilaginibacter rubeus]QTE47958.1 hypothetical protein J3L21_20640 [Mucilaginibacter rubeus]QTE59351.1 hypothetical protein J3L23_12310 [Mucilaginibacter rubeus]